MTDPGQAPMAPMSYDDWVERYSPVFDDAGSLVQYPTWESLPNGIDTRTVWAVIHDDGSPAEGCTHYDNAVTDEEMEAAGEACDCDPPPWVIFAGYHLVNVAYFTLARLPWSDDVGYVEWD